MRNFLTCWGRFFQRPTQTNQKHRSRNMENQADVAGSYWKWKPGIFWLTQKEHQSDRTYQDKGVTVTAALASSIQFHCEVVKEARFTNSVGSSTFVYTKMLQGLFVFFTFRNSIRTFWAFFKVQVQWYKNIYTLSVRFFRKSKGVPVIVLEKQW